jgi:acetyl esterase/lipase
MSQRPSTKHLVDPDLYPLLDRYANYPLNAEVLPEQRKEIAASAPADDGAGDGLPVRVERVSVPRSYGKGSVPVVLILPTGPLSQRGAILHIHGGGYVKGSPDQVLLRLRQQVHTLDCVIASVDYALAPEFPFPVGVEDCYAALRWLHEHAADYNVDRARIGVAGESAGGGLAAAVALLARDRKGPRLAFQNLLYPMLDDRTGLRGRPENPFAGEFVWPRESNGFGWDSLLGSVRGSDQVSPYAAPARAESLADLPSAYIAVGALDLLVDEDVEYAMRLSRAGVPVELVVYEGAVHGFNQAPSAAVAQRATEDRMKALARSLRKPQP